MILSVLMAAVLVVCTFGFHFQVLVRLSAFLPQVTLGQEARVFVVIVVAFLAHLVEVIAYAIGYALAERGSLGSLVGPVTGSIMDYSYYSLVSYTSLGLGDVSPSGHLRLLTGVEALNGLLLIAWSGAYTYLAMGRLWPWHSCE